MPFDLSIFATPEAWISLLTLTFLEVVLGVDNIVFISLTSNRLPENKQHLGRKLGLAGALIMRLVFLSFASALVHMSSPLSFTMGWPEHLQLSIRDIVLLIGGLYLIYKGVSELLTLRKESKSGGDTLEVHNEHTHRIGLPQAIGTIMVMDLVFSIDSVITAVGLVDQLIIMFIAVIVAIVVMMAFIDFISNFINKHVEMTILALCFITIVGGLLVCEGFEFSTHIVVPFLEMELEKAIIYLVMIISVICVLMRIRKKDRKEA